MTFVWILACDDRVEIDDAAYVGFAGGRLEHSVDAHVPAVVLYPCG
jgi:hypothetical protein